MARRNKTFFVGKKMCPGCPGFEVFGGGECRFEMEFKHRNLKDVALDSPKDSKTHIVISIHRWPPRDYSLRG